MAILSIASAYAQPRAIGGRFGGSGVEFSYQHGLGNNMLSIEAGLGYQYSRYDYGAGYEYYWGFGPSVAVTYDFINPFGADFPTISKGDWNWYMGIGAGANMAFNTNYNKFFSTGVGLAGRVGVEYNFWFPLQLSVDWRPLFGPQITTWNGNTDIGYYLGGLYGAALSVRYKF